MRKLLVFMVLQILARGDMENPSLSAIRRVRSSSLAHGRQTQENANAANALSKGAKRLRRRAALGLSDINGGNPPNARHTSL
jgi:hypothetical protein